MNSFQTLPARYLHRTFVILLRIVALASSFVLLMVLCTAFAVANIDTFTPWFLSEAASRSDGRFSFDHVDLTFRESSPALEIRGLSVSHQLVNGPLTLKAESVQVRLASPILTSSGVQIDHIGIAKPELDVAFLIGSDRDEEKSRGARALSFDALKLLALQSNIRTIDVSDGAFSVLLDSREVDVNALGEFTFETRHTDQGVSIIGTVDSRLHNQSNISYRLDLLESTDDTTGSRFQIDVQSLDAAWLAAVWAASGVGNRNINPATLTAVVDANVNGELVNSILESVSWNFKLRDSELDGNIPESTETIVKIEGGWVAEKTGHRIETEFELVDLDVRVVLEKYSTLFPPKFYKHMSERLNSLWVRRATGKFDGDPLNAILHKDLDQLSIDGNFQNVNFLYGKKWPALTDGSGTFKVRGKRLEITGSHGVIYGEEIGSLTGYVDDFTLPDPILHVSAGMAIPMPVVFDLFGPDGIVLPGKTKGITEGSGAGSVSLSVAVPLRRGKEYLIDGVAIPGDISVVTEYSPEVSQIRGQVKFDRTGITSGGLKAEALGGNFETRFTGSGTTGNYVIEGVAKGISDAAELRPIIGAVLGSELSGSFEWQADFRFEPNENTIAFSSSLTGLDSSLPFPMSKIPGLSVPLFVDIKTTNGTKREFDFDLASILSGTLNATLDNRTWNIHSGSLTIGDVDSIDTQEPGVHVALSLPELNFDQWSNLIADNESQSKLQIENLQAVTAQVDSVILARNRRLKKVDVTAQKKERYWKFQINSVEVVGDAEFRNTDFLQEGEYPHLAIELSKCHIPEAQSEPLNRSVDPRNVPNLDFSCSDMRYGQYDLGESNIQAIATNDSWQIKSANFQTPSLTISASGDWNYDQSSQIDFRFNSADFGAAMEQLGYPGRFDSGIINLSGHLFWNDALTKWNPSLTSGEIGFVAKDGTLINATNNPSTTVVGVLNYDTLLKKISVDVTDVLKGGIAYYNLAGKITVVNGIILVDGVQLNSPSVEIMLQGSTDWIRKQHNLVAGAESNVGKSLTTIATLINPIQGLFTYLAKEVLEELDIELFALNYQIKGSWDEPEIEVVKTNLLAPAN